MQIKKKMKELLKAMDFCAVRMERGKDSKMFYSIYQLLGCYAWKEIANECKHDYFFNKRKKLTLCRVCGTVKKEKTNAVHTTKR